MTAADEKYELSGTVTVDESYFSGRKTGENIRVQKRKKGRGTDKAKEVYLLSGLIVCGECGSSMYGNTRMCGRNKSKYASYRCSHRAQHKGCSNKELRKEYLENYVLDQLYQQLFSDHSIKKFASMLTTYNQQRLMENNT